MPVEIHDVRLSFIWVETFLDLLAEPIPTEAPLAFLGRSYTYEPQFDELLRDNRARIEPGLSLPWINFAHQSFWKNYFGNREPHSGKQCWKALVPLRGKLPVNVLAPWLSGRFLVEGFFYPHGIAFVVTATCEGQLTLEETVRMARMVRKTGKFLTQWPQGVSESVGLKTLADKALDALRTIALGPKTRPGMRSATPFTVLTVVRGAGVDPSIPVPSGGEIHRALEAVTSWSKNWRFDPLPDLDEADINTVGFDSDITYAHKRSRAVWFPGYFTSQDKGMHTLSCYHRNLVFASLTVESLTGLISETARYLHQGRSLSPAHRQCARQAAGILGRLYGGANSTYRSWSLIAHIEENEFEEVIDKVRRFFNMDELW